MTIKLSGPVTVNMVMGVELQLFKMANGPVLFFALIYAAYQQDLAAMYVCVGFYVVLSMALRMFVRLEVKINRIFNHLGMEPVSEKDLSLD